MRYRDSFELEIYRCTIHLSGCTAALNGKITSINSPICTVSATAVSVRRFDSGGVRFADRTRLVARLFLLLTLIATGSIFGLLFIYTDKNSMISM